VFPFESNALSEGITMKLSQLLAAAGLIAATLGSAANADPRYDNGWRHDHGRHEGWHRDDRRREWRNHRHCWIERHRHHDVRVCR
jgi:hypothetical protein